MSETRKGFTLVELLIVIAIISALSATFTYSVHGSSARAKAVAIASNVDTCRNAVAMYIVNNKGNIDFAEKTADDVLYEMIPTWVDFGSGSTTYKASGKDIDNWSMTVDFSGEGERKAIRASLASIKGYGKYRNGTESGDLMSSDDKHFGFTVMLSTGRLLPLKASEGGTTNP